MLGIAANRVAYVKRATPVWNGTSWLAGNYTPAKLPTGGGVPFRCYGWAAQSAAEVKVAGAGYAFSSPTLFVELYVPRELHHGLTGERIADLDGLDLIELPERGPVNEVQKITFSAAPTGGTWAVSFGGYTTTALAYNIANAALTTALAALPSIGPNNVNATKTGNEISVEFRGALAAAPLALLGVATAFTGTNPPSASVSRWVAGSPSAEALGQYLAVGYKRDVRGLTDWAPGYVLNLQRLA